MGRGTGSARPQALPPGGGREAARSELTIGGSLPQLGKSLKLPASCCQQKRVAFAAAKVLRGGDLLAIFPEGGITKDGRLQPFKGGIMKILENAQRDGVQAPDVPMPLTNLWGSFFSRVEKCNALVKPFRRGFFKCVGLSVGIPPPGSNSTPDVLHQTVSRLQTSTD